MKITVLPTTVSYMTSQFRWGFELEAYVKGDHTLPDIKKILDDHFGMTGLGVDTDASLPSIDEDTAFEYQSAILDITPTSLKKVGAGLASLKDIGVYVTNQCGFHTHFSHPNLSENDRKWILLGIAMDKEAVAKLTEFEGIPFWDAKYADTKFLALLAAYVRKGYDFDVSMLLHDEKRRVLRLHPQGTLEWRGPRNFLDKKDLRICMKYVTRVREVASIFNEKLEAKEVGGKTREEWEIRKDADIWRNSLKKYGSSFAREMGVDKIIRILKKAPWLREVSFKYATVELDNYDRLVWKNGIWKNGIWKKANWENGTWENGTWENGWWGGGTWNSGIWNSGIWNSGIWNSGVWEDGIWENGTWNGGTWENGTWAGGTWVGGTWKHGIWENGTWENGIWEYGGWDGGTWKSGVWRNGVWESGTWEGGVWDGGTWKSGTWKSGTWKSGTWKSGTWKSGTWEGGTWIKGTWEGGTWRGGTWKSGVWKGGKDANGVEQTSPPDTWT